MLAEPTASGPKRDVSSANVPQAYDRFCCLFFCPESVPFSCSASGACTWLDIQLQRGASIKSHYRPRL